VLTGKEVGVNVVVDGYTLRPGEVANERFVGVSPDYFETMGIPLLAGREFTEADVHPDSASNLSTTVAIINRTMTRRFFAHSSPIRKHFHFVEGNRPPLEIFGVVADSKYKDLREGPPTSSTSPARTATLKSARAAQQKPSPARSTRLFIRSIAPSPSPESAPFAITLMNRSIPTASSRRSAPLSASSRCC
jgi:hypothetical protein